MSPCKCVHMYSRRNQPLGDGRGAGIICCASLGQVAHTAVWPLPTSQVCSDSALSFGPDQA